MHLLSVQLSLSYAGYYRCIGNQVAAYMKTILFLSLCLVLQGCTVLGAIVDHTLYGPDHPHSEPSPSSHQESSFFSEGMKADAALFRYMRDKLNPEKKPEMECTHDGYFRVCRVLDDDSEF